MRSTQSSQYLLIDNLLYFLKRLSSTDLPFSNLSFSRIFSLQLFLFANCLLSFGLCCSSRATAQTTAVRKANYDLAAKWTAAKVNKLVFDTAVTPHWLETGDRFWYTYETNQGRCYFLVDPHAKTKKPLFDNAKMAAQLTRITLFPYDAQHLPIRAIKFIKKDTVLQFELDYSKDADVRAGEQIKSIKDIGDDGKQTQDKQNEDMKDKTKQTQAQKAVVAAVAAATTKTLSFEYDLAAEKLTLIEDYKAPPKKMAWATLSPDEKTVVFARGHNLFTMDAINYALAQKKADDKAIKETQLTTDGEEHYSFAITLRDEAQKKVFQDQEKERKDYRVPPIGIEWSKDSKKFGVVREDERKVADLWVINSLASPRPTLETYRYGMPGEENQPQADLLIFDVATRTRLHVKAEKYKDQMLGIANDRILSQDREKDKVVLKWLGDTSDKLYFECFSRDRHKLDVCIADTATGDVKVVIEERLNTYIDSQPLHLIDNGKNGREILFWSERDGWGHWYRYDESGKLLNQVTAGEYTCQDIVGIDAKAGFLYINACGHEAGEDPYFTHLYRIHLDGTGLKLVNPGDAAHFASMNDSAKYFVDNASRVNAAPVSQLRDGAGTILTALETTDVSALLEAGFTYPEPFKVKADDGITDLYGVMYKPFDFDPKKHYPIIAYVYPGPQLEAVSKTFSPRNANVALAQFGFIVIEVGNRGGSPQRSKWYHNFGYGNLRDYGLADKKHAIEQLAMKYPFIDIERVGITGHSGGGFMSAAAMLIYPDFFKVAVSESGNHENNIYNRWWSESHHGVKEVKDKDGKSTFEYNIEKNSEIAKNLKGHLMLVTGDIDDNVHPANTLRLANALIRANKRFDFFMLPGQRHGFGDMSEYFFWLRSDYFCKYLLGYDETSVDMLELNREKEQVGDKRPRP